MQLIHVLSHFAGSTTSTTNMHHKYVPSNATDEGGFFPPATKEVAVWYQPNISTALESG